MAEKIHECIDYIRVAPNIDMLVKYKIRRCHALKSDRVRQYSMDLDHPYRLIFIPEDDTAVSVSIEEIVDYH